MSLGRIQRSVPSLPRCCSVPSHEAVTRVTWRELALACYTRDLTLDKGAPLHGFANPELYDPDAQQRIEEAIARVEDVLRNAQLKFRNAKQNPHPA